MAKFSYKSAEMQSTVVELDDGRVLEVRRGELTGRAIPDRVTWNSLAAWRAWLPAGAVVDGLEAAEPPAAAAAGGGGVAPAVPEELLQAHAVARQDAQDKVARHKDLHANFKQRKADIRQQMADLQLQLQALRQEEAVAKVEVEVAWRVKREAQIAEKTARHRVAYFRAAAGRDPAAIRAEAEALNAAIPGYSKRDMAVYSTFAIHNACLLHNGLPLDSDRYLWWDRSVFLEHIQWSYRIPYEQWDPEPEEAEEAGAHALAAAAAERGIPVWVAEAWAEQEAEDAAAEEEEEARPAVVEEAIAAALRYEREVLG
jgi:hypothetical protein